MRRSGVGERVRVGVEFGCEWSPIVSEWSWMVNEGVVELGRERSRRVSE